jgi:hypothetical protein
MLGHGSSPATWDSQANHSLLDTGNDIYQNQLPLLTDSFVCLVPMSRRGLDSQNTEADQLSLWMYHCSSFNTRCMTMGLLS